MQKYALTNAVIYTGEKVLYEHAVVIEKRPYTSGHFRERSCKRDADG